MSVQELIDLLQQQPDMSAGVVVRESGSNSDAGALVYSVVTKPHWRGNGDHVTYIEHT